MPSQPAARPVRIAVVGERAASPENIAAAHAVGAAVARRGGIVVCGGMGGVMQAASEGCTACGGLVIGILPTADAGDANPYVGVPIVTGLGEGRNVLIARTAEAMIAVGGSYGTLSEIALALRFAVPVIGLRTWELQAPAHQDDPIVRASTPEDAVEKAWQLALRGRERNV